MACFIGTYDVEGVEKRQIHDLVDFAGKSVFEIGCGRGRMTRLFADAASYVLAFDPDPEAIATARDLTPDEIKDKVEYRVAGLLDVDLTKKAFDVGVFSWSI